MKLLVGARPLTWHHGRGVLASEPREQTLPFVAHANSPFAGRSSRKRMPDSGWTQPSGARRETPNLPNTRGKTETARPTGT